MMNIEGYGCVVSWDGQTLRAKGTNKATHRALMGQNWELTEMERAKMIVDPARQATTREVLKETFKIPDELVLERDQFTISKFKTGNMMTNGILILTTPQGVNYQLHFRKKHNQAFTELHDALQR